MGQTAWEPVLWCPVPLEGLEQANVPVGKGGAGSPNSTHSAFRGGAAAQSQQRAELEEGFSLNIARGGHAFVPEDRVPGSLPTSEVLRARQPRPRPATSPAYLEGLPGRWPGEGAWQRLRCLRFGALGGGGEPMVP